jgi:hypothetical protein
MAIVISPKIREKLADKHCVTPEEVKQCFCNRTGEFLIDPREEHASDPPTLWFISETNYGRQLKIACIFDNGNVYIRSAFEPNAKELRIYAKDGFPS